MDVVRKMAEAICDQHIIDADIVDSPPWSSDPAEFVNSAKAALAVLSKNVTPEMFQAAVLEEEQWGVRRNKGEPEPWEVFRHDEPDVVTPRVIKKFTHEDEARTAHDLMKFSAMFAAALLVLQKEK